jgi:hypothetical protein
MGVMPNTWAAADWVQPLARSEFRAACTAALRFVIV